MSRATTGRARNATCRYRARNGPHDGVENSQMTIRPPGRVTRCNSVRAAWVSSTLRSPNEIVTASKEPSAKGRLSASALTNGRSGWRRLPTSIIPKLRSAGTTSAPASANGRLLVPVPAARSSTRSPGFGATAATTARRHARSSPPVSRSLTRS